jgi:hypothetical protein
MNMHRLSTGVYGRVSRFGDSGRGARYCRMNPVAIQSGLQENGVLHFSSPFVVMPCRDFKKNPPGA